MDKRLVRGEQSVPTGEEVAFQPPLARMFAEDLHHPSVRRQVVVLRERLCHPRTICDFEQRIESIRIGFIRTEHPKIACREVQFHYVAEKTTHRACRFGEHCSWSLNLDSIG